MALLNGCSMYVMLYTTAVVQMCNTHQEVIECISSFRWYCGYQPPALACIKERRHDFQNLLGNVLSHSNSDNIVDSNPSVHVFRVAGMNLSNSCDTPVCLDVVFKI